MKRYFYYVVAGILALCAASCTTNELDGKIEGNNILPNELPSELYVTIDNGEGDTRIQLNEECKTVWTEDDMVSVFYRSDANNKFLFMGDTGDRSGALVVEENRMADATAQIDKVVLLYPYSDNYKLNATTKSVAVQIPGTQYYQNGSYGVGANLMASVGTSNDFALKSVCGWIEIKLTGAASVTSVTLTGNDKEQLAGDATLYYEDLRLALLGEDGGPDDSSQVGGSLFFGEYVRTITLDCGEGVALDSTTPTSFYFVLAPQTFDEGITIKATLSDGTTITKSTSKSLTISRNTIRPMAAFDVQPTDEIWYTSTDGNIVEPCFSDRFGANIVSNTYENGKGVIKFDGDVTEIGQQAFYSCDNLLNISIPQSVTWIGIESFRLCRALKSFTIPNSVSIIYERAFSDCDNLAAFYGKYASEDNRFLVIDGALNSFASAGLTDYVIPDSVTSIGDLAFSGCQSLTSLTIPDSVTSIGRYAFSSCENLISINGGNNVIEIEGGAFTWCTNLTAFNSKYASEDNRCLIIDGVLYGFASAGLTTYTIPDSVTSIGEQVFRYYENIVSITIPNSVTSIGDSAFAFCRSLTSIVIPDSVTEIKDSTFANCTSLTSITIPDSVTEIGGYAFSCSNLTNIVIPDSVTRIENDVFNLCEKLSEVYCLSATPPTVQKTGGYIFLWDAFKGCNSELQIYVPLESVDAYKAADGWSEYADAIVGFEPQPANNEIWYTSTDGSIVEPYDATVFGANIVSNTYTNGKGVIKFDENIEVIGAYAFWGRAKLVSVIIPNSVTEIRNNAFDYCQRLESIIMPDNVAKIGNFAFHRCESLTNVTIPDSVTSIESYTFSTCLSLESVIIPDSVTEIGSSAFSNCSSLKSITIPDSVITIGDYVFGSCSSLSEIKGKFASNDGKCLIVDGVLKSFAPAGVKEYTLPDSITKIGEGAFYHCYYIASLTIPDNVTTISERAFLACSGLTEFKGKYASSDNRYLIKEGELISFAPALLTNYTLPDDITKIGQYGFSNCYSAARLTSITLSQNISDIEWCAFDNCPYLTELYCKSTTPARCSSGMFGDGRTDTSIATIYVPTESVDAYKSADIWSDYADYIVGYDFE